MGYWVDLDDAYRTMDPEYVESVWWSLKQIFDKGLLVQDYRVAPWCPRCGTGLSDHELAQGYETVVDPSVYVRFPLTSGPLAGEAALLVWTTTPWTLVSNTAVAAHPDVTYVVATDGDGEAGRRRAAARQGARRGLGAAPASLHRRARWSAGPTSARSTSSTFPADAHYVVNAEYVTTEDGTGLVHQSPAFGEDDLEVCRAYGLPVVNPVRPDGTFEEDVPLVGGVFFKKADEALVTEDLAAARPAVPARPVRAQLPALLALPHRAALLRAAVLVHPHHRGQGRAAAGERDAPTGTRRRSSTAATATG